MFLRSAMKPLGIVLLLHPLVDCILPKAPIAPDAERWQRVFLEQPVDGGLADMQIIRHFLDRHYVLHQRVSLWRSPNVCIQYMRTSPALSLWKEGRSFLSSFLNAS